MRGQRYKKYFTYASAGERARDFYHIFVNFYTIYLVFPIFCSTYAADFGNKSERMKRKLLIGMVSCLLATCLHAETIRVMRFVPVAGAESEVAINSLQKVVFTPDSVVLISAKGGAATPMYKYDYQAIVFEESSTEELEEVKSEELRAKSEKFIKDGQLFIRRDGQVFNILGIKVIKKNYRENR